MTCRNDVFRRGLGSSLGRRLRPLAAAAGEFAVILGDRVLIARWDLGRVGVSNRAAAVFIELATQLQFQRVHVADQLLVHLFNQGGIPGETAGIQIAHFLDQGLQLCPRLGIVLDRGANLVQSVQGLIDLALGVGGARILLRSDGLLATGASGARVLTGIDVAVGGAAGTAAARITGEVADGAPLASAALTWLTLTIALALALALPLTLTLTLTLSLSLTLSLALALLLARLSVAAELAGLAGFALALTSLTLTRLPLTILSVGTSPEVAYLVAYAG
jgi:hypothetical protein